MPLFPNFAQQGEAKKKTTGETYLLMNISEHYWILMKKLFGIETSLA